MDKTKILLLGMTGLGNNTLKVLGRQPDIEIIGVFTPPKEVADFPYYECEKLAGVATERMIPTYEGWLLKEEKTSRLIKKLSPDLIVVGSFNQIVPEAIISIPKLGVINIHPSLLPKYRGATPTVWTLLNGEEETGITVHYIEDKRIDSGPIIAQARLKIDPSDTDGSLRFRLANLSEKVLEDALLLIRGENVFPPQDESEATFYPKRTLEDSEINLNNSFQEITDKIRAFTPCPHARLNYGGKQYIIESATLLNNGCFDRIGLLSGGNIVLKIPQGIIEFKIVEEN